MGRVYCQPEQNKNVWSINFIMPEHSAIIKEVGGTLIERVPDLMKGDIVPQQICAHSLCDCVLVFSTGCVLVGLGSFLTTSFLFLQSLLGISPSIGVISLDIGHILKNSQ